MKKNSLYLLTASEIVRAVLEGVYSVQEITESFIARTEKIEPFVSAWVARDNEYLRWQAAEIDAKTIKGPLAGVPFGIKDVFNTEVLPTQMGSPVWKGYRAGNDARCVAYIKWMGGLVAGKTDTAEFAVHTPGKAINPYNSSHITGTSSGGSAAAVATAMVPAALGTQTAGSAIRPASWCGVYAMKPSFGLIPRTGVLKTTDTLDNIAFFGRSIADLRLILEGIHLRGENYPFIQRNLVDESKKTSWRVGLYRSHLWNYAPEYARDALVEFAKQLNRVPGINVDDCTLPETTYTAHELHSRIYNPCLSYYFREEIEKDPEEISPCFMDLVDDGEKYSPEDYKLALREQELLSHAVHESVSDKGFDFILCLSSNGSAPVGVEPIPNMDTNLLWTLCWMPAVNVPVFKCPAGLPFGAQFTSARYNDLRLLGFLDYLKETSMIPTSSTVINPSTKKNRTMYSNTVNELTATKNNNF
jgi:Asp-tRNA(Asn)/Glu-tRNA(Gln) amidotransferase A subunit family amidase